MFVNQLADVINLQALETGVVGGSILRFQVDPQMILRDWMINICPTDLFPSSRLESWVDIFPPPSLHREPAGLPCQPHQHLCNLYQLQVRVNQDRSFVKVFFSQVKVEGSPGLLKPVETYPGVELY